MSLIQRLKLKWPLLVIGILALFSSFAIRQFAQTTTQSRTGYVNDFAAVLDEPTRNELTTMLENLKQKTGIELAVVTVDSTGGQSIDDYSLKLAREWNFGALSSSRKSLLMVVSVSDRSSFIRYSRSAQSQLPDGVLGDVTQRMRSHLEASRFRDGVDAGVKHLVGSMAEKLSLPIEDFTAGARTDEPKPASTPTADPAIERTETAKVSEPTPEPSPVATATQSPETITSSASTTVTAGSRSRRVTSTTTTDDDESEAVELTLTLPVEDRVVKLKEFLRQHPESKSRGRAIELLVSAYAAAGDERLKKGDSAAGVERLMLAITEAPVTSSDRLYHGVIAQIPLNLFVRGERDAAVTAAKQIEEKFGGDAKRLLAVANFHLTTEQGIEAARVARRAISLAPDLGEAHQTLALAMHISLHLEEAMASYKRAVELNPNLKSAQRSLADLHRALGRPEAALELYRQQLAADAKDKAARAGVVLSLLDLGKSDEAKTELDAALQADPANLTLLAGAAYWFAAHNDSQKALELGSRALAIEPRYTWSQVAVARALVAQRNPMAAERAVRFAKQYGSFPTLDYELATTLVATGLFDEAAEVLMQAFSLKDGQIHTSLGGKTAAVGPNFIELLAPERRASIFQAVPADTEQNAKLLKDLLSFATVLNQTNVNEQQAVSLAKQFASGQDAWRVHRQLYAASKLMQKGIGYETAYELAEAARSSADAGLTVPALTLVVQADEYRDMRARAIASGGTPQITDAPSNVLANILRGRIEDISGWALFNLDKPAEAVEHLRRAANILPAGTPSWRTTLWHLGATLERLDQKDEALVQYIRSYNAGDPDPVRRSVIERLYRQMKGSLEGLDQEIRGIAAGSQPVASPVTQPSPSPAESSVAVSTPSPAVTEPAAQPTPAATPESTPEQPAEPSATPESTPEPTPSATPRQRSSFDPRPDTETPTPRPSPKPSPSVVTITGQVMDANNTPVANVVVVLITPQGTVLASTTNEQGFYSFKVAASSQSYRLVPSKEGFVFDPVDKVLANASEDSKGLNFVAVVKSP
ncbi:MAG TPA: TPM domain-containing protein [Pyrinomonadaceae bacterium]|nr:TPM domain-containing protein [Pyrinomonadaceae bacterium]